jgi:hypothetical protein
MWQIAARFGYDTVVSSTELLRHFHAMSAAERTKFLTAAKLRRSKPANNKPRRMGAVVWPDIEARSKRIERRRLLPNLGVLEREDSAF